MAKQQTSVEITTAKLIGQLLLERQPKLKVGLVAASLPPFDVSTLLNVLQPIQDKIKLAFLGYDGIPSELATDVEKVIEWRNSPTLTKPIIVLLNRAEIQNKTHSLEMFEPLTDDELHRAIISHAEKSTGNPLVQKFWHELSLLRTQTYLPLVAHQVAELYNALQASDISAAMPLIGLLPDPELGDYAADSEKFTKRLKENRIQIDWLSELSGRDFRNLARALENNASSHKATFRKLRSYVQNPSYQTLSALTLQEILDIQSAKKAESPTSSGSNGQTTEMPTLASLVSQLLTLDPEKDRDALAELQHQANRISDLFIEELHDDYTADITLLGNNHSQPEENGDEIANDIPIEVFMDVRTHAEISKIKRPTDKKELHPLDEYMSIWVHPQCWGGQYTVDNIGPQIKSIVSLLDDDSVILDFTPLNPLDTTKNDSRQGISLINLVKALDPPVHTGKSLYELLLTLHERRKVLTYYRSLFLYYPDQATVSSILGPAITAYITGYHEFAEQLRQVCQTMSATNPDATQRALAQFLALDSVIFSVDTNDGKLPEKSVVLTPLHPLHLWKWYTLIRIASNTNYSISGTVENKLLNVLNKRLKAKLPTLLNTFLLHEHMFAPSQPVQDGRLILAGELDHPTSDITVGVPYYVPNAFQASTDDGLKEFVDSISRFVEFYPPAQIGITLAIVDPPPNLSPLLLGLYELYENRKLYGARIYVYYTLEDRAVFNEWTIKDEPALRLIRDNPHWEFHRNRESLDYDKIVADIQHPRHLYPHIILVCDPSQPIVVQSPFRQVQEETHPFGIPVQLTYDNITDEITFVSTASGNLFEIYDNLRNTLSGELRRKVMSLGNKTVDPEKLRAFFADGVEAHWLAIIDRPQGTLQLPPTIGRRLARQYVGARTLAIHTNEKDWQIYWREHLNRKLRDIGMEEQVDPDILLKLFPVMREGLLRLVRISIENEQAQYGPIDVQVLQSLLGLVAVLNWVRGQHSNAALVRLDDEFEDWYNTSKGEFDYAAFWLDDNGLHVDLMSIQSELCRYSDMNKSLSEAKPTLETLAEFANVLTHSLQDNRLVGPIFRSVLRERLTSAIFSTADSDLSGPLQQSKLAKKEWEDAINGLDLAKYFPTIRLLTVRVALKEIEHEADISQSYKIENDDFTRIVVKLPGSYLGGTQVELGELKQSIEEQLPTLTDAPHLTAVIEEPTPLQHPLSNEPILFRTDAQTNKGVTSVAQALSSIEQQVITQAANLRRVLIDYGIAIAEVNTEKSQIGPRFIRYWVRLQPPAGRLSEMLRYAEDIARELGSETVPIISNIAGERYVGVDLAREHPLTLNLSNGIDALPAGNPEQLLIAMGENVAGEAIQLDLATLPHMLVAGQTGSGKTVFLSSIITSLIRQQSPATMQLVLIDPKQTDFSIFSHLPHLRNQQIIYEPEDAVFALQTLLENDTVARREQLNAARCPNIQEFNRRNPEQRIPWIVVVIDEFADLILSLSRGQRTEFERQVNRLAAAGRSVGIRLVIATQRPTTDVITGTIKANIPARVSFRLPSQIDSRTILDRPGAENLLGKGDMLVLNDGIVQRLQGYYATFDQFIELLEQAGY